jgi:hypothetical protein
METRLKPETAAAFDRYSRAVEEPGGGVFLWVDRNPERLAAVRSGKTVIEQSRQEGDIPDGALHDWTGALFVHGATLPQVLNVLQSYDRYVEYYKPEVIASRLLARDGERFHVSLRLRKAKILTVVLNSEYEVEYRMVSPAQATMRSVSTKMRELKDFGKPGEQELAEGYGHGFLWRLNAFWRFQERDGGVYVECRALSLSRDVPRALAWIISPITRKLPRESLGTTLEATRAGALRSLHN